MHNIFVQKKKGILSVEPPFFLETTEPATLPLNFLSLGTENKKEKKKLVCCTPNDGSSFCFSFTLAGTSLSVRLNLLEARYSDLSYLSFSATTWYILLLFWSRSVSPQLQVKIRLKIPYLYYLSRHEWLKLKWKLYIGANANNMKNFELFTYLCLNHETHSWQENINIDILLFVIILRMLRPNRKQRW